MKGIRALLEKKSKNQNWSTTLIFQIKIRNNKWDILINFNLEVWRKIEQDRQFIGRIFKAPKKCLLIAWISHNQLRLMETKDLQLILILQTLPIWEIFQNKTIKIHIINKMLQMWATRESQKNKKIKSEKY